MSTYVNLMSSMGDAGLLAHKRSLIGAKFNQSRTFGTGFSLLELLVVVSLLGMLALATTVMVDNTDDQQRFELTRTRLQQIRTAIIGDPSRTFNGEPVLSGFAMDMGRLPANINELVELPAGANVWQGFPIATSSASAVGEVYAGWRGQIGRAHV